MGKIKSVAFIVFIVLQLLWVSGCKETNAYPQVTLSSGDSYDFTSGAIGRYEGGDLYYYVENGQHSFWANNAGQNGIVDVGVQDVDLEEIANPGTGFYKFGVPCVVDHVYVSLAMTGEPGHYIVFRVVALDPAPSCTIEWLYK